MGKIGDLWVRLGLKKDEFTAGLESAERQSQSFSQKVGSYFTSMAAKAVAVGAAFAAIGRGMSEAVRNIAQFERANSELAAVLGKSASECKGLQQSAKELGRTSEFTASEVTQLQIALARLGFDTGQIEKMQKSVLNFALAMGTDLASAAEFTGASLRAFGLEAKDTDYLLDVMSKSTTLSALNFSKLQTSIGTVAPIAKSFGLNVQETAAFLGVLANNGFDASTAATSLRNILLNLADANGKLAKGIGHTARTFPEIIAAFKELQEKGIDVGEVLQMTDRRTATAATAIIAMAGDVDTLKKSLDEAEGSLNTMADTMADNLIGSVKALKSAWEGLTLAFEGSKGPMKWVVERLTDILNRLTDILSGNKVSFIETILGPVMGGAIKGASNRRKEEKAAPEYEMPGEGTSGGGGRGGAGYNGTKPKVKLTDEELEKLRREQDKKWKKTLERTLADVKDAVAEQMDKAVIEIPSPKVEAPDPVKVPEPEVEVPPIVKVPTPEVEAPDPIEVPAPEVSVAPVDVPAPEVTVAPVEVPAPEVVTEPVEIPAMDISKAEQQTDKLAQLWERLAAAAPGPDEAREAWEKYQQAIKDAAGEISAEEAEIRKADAELAAAGDEAYNKWREIQGFGPPKLWDDDLNRYLEKGLQLAEQIGNELNTESLYDSLNKQLDEFISKTVKARQSSEELAKAISENLVSALEDGAVGAFEALADVMGGVTEGGMEQVVKALLDPLAEMAIKAGTLIMMSGTAIEALKESLTNFFGGSAVVAGAALVAVGIAAKAGLAAIGNRGSAGTGVTSMSSSGSPYGGGNGVQTAELTVYVEGTVHGSDIILSGQNTLNSWNR